LNAEDSTKGLEIYQKHLKQTDSLINYYENAKTLSGIIGSKLPTLKPPPETFLKQMKSYVENPENFNEDDEKNDNVTPLKDLLGFDESKGEVKFDDIFETSKHNEDSPENSSNTKSHGGNDNDNDGFGPSNDDPFSQDPFTSDDPFAQDPFSQDPFETKPQKTTSQPSTTQAPQKTSQPQKTTLDLDDLFSSPSNVQPVNTYPTTKPQNPFSPTPQQFTPKPVQSNPFSPVPVQSTNPFQQPQTNPFQQSNPFQQPQTNPFQNPYQQSQQGSFGQPKQNYYGGPQQNLSQPKQNNPGFQKFDFSESQVVKPKQETHAFDFLTDITKDAPKKQNQPQPKQQGSFGQQGFGNDPFNDSDPFGSDPF
jgi:hypothetical protein